MEKPYFSVIMPTYNRSHTILQAVQSILNQRFTDFELIIIDDGSTDDTSSIVSELKDTRIKYIRQKNTRQTQARRAACQLANGQVLAFCDSDDIWTDSFLIDLHEIFLSKNADYVFSNYKVQGEEKPRINASSPESAQWFTAHAQRISENLYYFKDLYTALLKYQPIFCSCQAITRKHYDLIGGISEKINNPKLGPPNTSEDSHIIRRSALTHNAYYLDKVDVHLGRQGDNTSSSYTSNLKGGLTILLDIFEHSELSLQQRKDTAKEIRRHRQQLGRQIYYFQPAIEYRDFYLSTPKFDLDLKNHLHFARTLLRRKVIFNL